MSVNNINNISSEAVKERLKAINSQTPFFWATTSIIKAPAEVTARTAVRNNLMLDQVLENQTTIMDNQQKIMKKLDIEA